jgi:iron(III) transport system substrate-binding protein
MQKVALSVSFVVIVLIGCSRENKQTLVVYSPHGKEMLGEFARLFEAAHPDVDVQWLDMGSQDAYDRIRTEKQNPQADIWWGAPSLTFAKAEGEGLLEKYVPTWNDAVGSEFKSPQDYWYGTFITPEVIMYNNRVLTPEDAPRDWDDLLDEKWKGKIIIRYPLASGTMRIIYSALIQRSWTRTGNVESGFEWLKKLDANTKSYTADPTQLYLKIARDEGVVTLWNLPDVIMQVQINGYPFGYVVPASGTPLITDCIAIVKGTRNLERAKQFYEFVTSQESVILQARDFFRIPARSDIANEELPRWIRDLKLTPMSIDWQQVAAHERDWMRQWEEQVRGRGNHGE